MTKGRTARVAYLETNLKTALNTAKYTRIYFCPLLTKLVGESSAFMDKICNFNFDKYSFL